MVAFTFTYPYVYNNLQEGGNFESLRAALVTAFGTAGPGTVTNVSVVTANGFAGTVANPGTTPAITISTSITGILKGNGTAVAAAVGGTDYVVPGSQGQVLQMVSTETGAVATGTTSIPGDDTIPQQSGPAEGDQYMSLTITPKSATSKLVITSTVILSSSVVSLLMTAALFQDSTAGALAAAFQTTVAIAGQPITLTFTHVMTSGTTSATTFKVRAGTNAASTTTFNGSGGARFLGGVLASSIVIQEIVP